MLKGFAKGYFACSVSSDGVEFTRICFPAEAKSFDCGVWKLPRKWA